MSITTNAGIENGYFGQYKWNEKNNCFDFYKKGKAVTLEVIEESIETDEVTLVLSFEYQRKKKIIRVPRTVLADKANISELIAKGSDVNGQNYKFFVDTIYLQEEEKDENGEDPTVVFNNLGWITIPYEKDEDDDDDDIDDENNKTFALYYRGNTLIGTKADTRYIGNYAVKPNGTFNEWRNLVINDVVGHSALELVLLAGLSAVTVGLLSINNTVGHPIFHLNYESGKGKTTALYLGVSVSSKPFDGNKTERDFLGIPLKKKSLYQSWGATENALTARCAGNQGAVMVLNELAKFRGSSLTQVVFNFSEGTDKERANTSLDTYILDSYHTTFISCGEESLIDRCANLEGIHTRVMELEEQLTVDADHANRIKDVCSKNNGFAAPMLADYIIKNGGLNAVQELYEQHISYLKAILPDYPQKERFIQTFPAIIFTTAELASKALNINFDMKGIESFFTDYMIKKGKEESKVEKDYAELISYLRSNLKHFNTNPLDENVPEPWGRVLYPTPSVANNYLVESYEVETGMAHNILKQLGHKNAETTLKAFRDAGYLDHEKNALTRKRRIYADSKDQVKVNVFQIFTAPTNLKKQVSSQIIHMLNSNDDDDDDSTNIPTSANVTDPRPTIQAKGVVQ